MQDQRKIRLLLVDDVAVFLQLECMFLQRRGYEIITAVNGRECLDLARKHKPDLILLDLVLPDISGAECCRQIKKDPDLKGIPIIMVTSSGKEEERAGCMEAGCDDYITKPVTQMVLAKRVQEVLNIRLREARRLAIGVPVRYGTDAQKLDQRGVTLNISATGMFIVTKDELSPAEKLTVAFQLPGVPQMFRLKAEVVWNTKGVQTAAITRGFGMKFTNASPEEFRVLDHFVNARLE